MKFDHDPQKSQSNKLKHGLDFDEARALWEDERGLVIPAHFRDEERFAMIARLGQTLWTAIFTERGQTRRLISCRRARKEEAALYEQE
ncbi:MAG: BrnT family toxin [Candidatus Adiutrix sp.]|jgi:uncharacterized DUF497 family protein|nr:BrnT family toxin [Candidatus Adiutrix sp.]